MLIVSCADSESPAVLLLYLEFVWCDFLQREKFLKHFVLFVKNHILKMGSQIVKAVTAAVALLATTSFVNATPHRHEEIVKRHDQKRGMAVVTITDIVTETIDITTTIWVNDEPTYVPDVAYTTPTGAAAETTPSLAGYQPSPTTFATSVSVAAPAYTPEVETSAAEATPISSTSTALVIESASSVIQNYAAAATTAAATTSTSSDSSSDVYTGDITFYDTEGTSACGDSNIDGYSYDAIALPYAFMGTQSNDNPYCGKTITIKNGDKTATGTVIDKCMGCTGMSIDLSRHLFDQLADESLGRVSGVEWWFN